MLPAIPSQINPRLDQLMIDVVSSSAALGKGLPPLILKEIARLMMKVNSYYTNAMEGNPTKLRDIEAALNHHFAKNETVRNYQREHIAHIEVQEEMIHRLQKEPELNICSPSFICWLHEKFYLKLPEDMRFAKTVGGELHPVVPGELRDRGITVGRHHAPERKQEVESYLKQFEELMNPDHLIGTGKLLGMAASHHRLLWIHPFSDGNGRVARLLTVAYGVKIGVGDNLLWTVTRAFARRRQDYDAHLAMADRPRRNDLDGRGPLSEEDLVNFCAFFFDCCLDQIGYMKEMLKLDDLERRYKIFLNSLVQQGEISKSSARVMEKLIVQGKVGRAEVLGICRVKQRRATQVIKELLDRKRVRSATAYGDLTLNISVDMAAALFPELV